MLKKLGLLVAFTSLSFNAMADIIVYDLGSHTLDGAQSVGGSFDFLPPDATTTSVTISFDYFEDVPDASWASDARVTLLGPGGQVVDVGGFTSPLNDPAPWVFDGSGSNLNGSYSDTFTLAPLSAVGVWSWTLTNDWAGDLNPNKYNNLEFAIDYSPAPAVPLPAAAWLFISALAGLYGTKRLARAA